MLDASDFTDAQELEQIRVRMRLMLDQASLVPIYLATIQELRQEVAAFVAERRGLSPTHPYPLLVSAAASTAWDVALHAWATGHPGSLANLRRSVFDQLAVGISPIVT